MAWTIVAPQRGVRAARVAGVTISARHDGSPTLKINVTLSAPVATQLGWAKKMRAQVEMDEAGTRLRFSVADHQETFALHGVASGPTLALRFALPHGLTGGKRKPELVPHIIEGGALIVDLPAWARRAALRAAIPLVEQPRSPTPAEIQSAKIRAGIAAAKAAREGSAGPSPHRTSAARLSTPTARDAAPPTARDELEAKAELRKGADARLVSDEFGIGLNIVSRWAAEVREEKAQAA